MPWKTTSIMEERIKFVILANQSSINFSGLCNDFGISRPTGWVAHSLGLVEKVSECCVSSCVPFMGRVN